MRLKTALSCFLALTFAFTVGCGSSPKILPKSVQTTRGVTIHCYRDDDTTKSRSKSHHDDSGEHFYEDYSNASGRQVHLEFWVTPDMTLMIDGKKYGVVESGDLVELYFAKKVLVNGKSRSVTDPKSPGLESRTGESE